MSYQSWFFASRTFCCCLPLRLGVIVMSFISILLSGILSLALWYQVSTTHSSAKIAFAVAGVVETVYFLASIFGLFGSLVKKQSFVTVFAYFIYFHFLVNLGVGIWLMWFVVHAVNKDISAGCVGAIMGQVGSSCQSDLNLVKGVVIGFTISVLLTELYCASIVARYLHNLKTQNRRDRASLSETGFTLLPQKSKDLGDSGATEFNPYGEIESPGPHPDREQGYGGGRWTHNDIADAEKRRMRELERAQEPTSSSYVGVSYDEQGGGHARPLMEDEGPPGYDAGKAAPYMPAEKSI